MTLIIVILMTLFVADVYAGMHSVDLMSSCGLSAFSHTQLLMLTMHTYKCLYYYYF